MVSVWWAVHLGCSMQITLACLKMRRVAHITRFSLSGSASLVATRYNQWMVSVCKIARFHLNTMRSRISAFPCVMTLTITASALSSAIHKYMTTPQSYAFRTSVTVLHITLSTMFLYACLSANNTALSTPFLETICAWASAASSLSSIRVAYICAHSSVSRIYSF